MPEKYSKPKPDLKAVEADIRRQQESHRRQPARGRWRDLYELATWMWERSLGGRNVVLSPTTAAVVAAQLALIHTKPTRDEIALLICYQGEPRRCSEPCYTCKAKANSVVAAYGQRPDDRQG